MTSQWSDQLARLAADLAELDQQIVILASLFIATVIVLDAVTLKARKNKEDTGIGIKHDEVKIEGIESIEVRQYLSETQGLAGRPDALIVEGGMPVPVERKPLARKVRDRYVAQLLVYMRLIEEFEGKKPPHGYLILGPSCRRVKIENTPERQAWLQERLDQMRYVLEGGECVPSPQPKKCAKCDVRSACKFGGYLGSVEKKEPGDKGIEAAASEPK